MPETKQEKDLKNEFHAALQEKNPEHVKTEVADLLGAYRSLQGHSPKKADDLETSMKTFSQIMDGHKIFKDFMLLQKTAVVKAFGEHVRYVAYHVVSRTEGSDVRWQKLAKTGLGLYELAAETERNDFRARQKAKKIGRKITPKALSL